MHANHLLRSIQLVSLWHVFHAAYLKQLDLKYLANGREINFTESQQSELERNFQYAHTLHPSERLAIAYQLSLPEQAVNDWFKNRFKKYKSERAEENIAIQAGPGGRLINVYNSHKVQVTVSICLPNNIIYRSTSNFTNISTYSDAVANYFLTSTLPCIENFLNMSCTN